MMSEREHWLSITTDPEWRRNHIADPNISLDATVDAIVSAFPADAKRVLELGCGYGRLTREVGKRLPDVSVIGLDVNPAVLSEARLYDPDTEFVCGATLMPFTELDAIYSVAVFQHLPDNDKYAYIREAYEALNDGGVIRLQFIAGVRDNFNDHWVPVEQMVTWMERRGFTIGVTGTAAHPQWTWITGIK